MGHKTDCKRSDLIHLSAWVARVTSLAPEFDGSDPYGSAMNVWFECADRLNFRGVMVPAEWEYVSGYGSGELDESYAEYENGYLFLLGNAAMKLTEWCKKLDLSY